MDNSELPTRVSGAAAIPAACARLVDAQPDVRLRVLAVDRFQRAALAQEGILEGGLVHVERRLALGGPLIVRVGRTRIALARSVAEQVTVEAIDAETTNPAENLAADNRPEPAS